VSLGDCTMDEVRSLVFSDADVMFIYGKGVERFGERSLGHRRSNTKQAM
jgi:hypothetical protein